MKKLLPIIAIMLAVCACLFSAGCTKKPSGGSSSSSPKPNPEPSDIVFYLAETAEVSEYDRITLAYELSGANPSDIVWSSSNPAVVTVIDGSVIGVKAGVAVISANVGNITRNCSVTVVKNASYPSLILSQTDAMPRVGGSVKITASVRFNGEITDFADFNWSSSDKNVATCVNGVITGVSKGTAIITVSATYNGIYLEETVAVTVSAE